jgi:PIN domain nuclease of toxin-antitoxin system
VILLDTHALLWVHTGHRRTRALVAGVSRLHACPVSLLEIGFLVEAGRLRLRHGAEPKDLMADDRWLVDEPPCGPWFERALDLGWTRDPFDRLLVAHALVRRWKLATAGEVILANMAPGSCVEI